VRGETVWKNGISPEMGVPKALERSQRSRDRPLLAAEEARSRGLGLFSKQFRKGYSPKFGLGLRKRSALLPISRVSRRVQAPKRTFEEVKHMNSGKGIYVGGTLLSILISLALYFSGKRETAIFVGLWAPTILNLGQTLMDED
jgi:hypothetical protein